MTAGRAWLLAELLQAPASTPPRTALLDSAHPKACICAAHHPRCGSPPFTLWQQQGDERPDGSKHAQRAQLREAATATARSVLEAIAAASEAAPPRLLPHTTEHLTVGPLPLLANMWPKAKTPRMAPALPLAALTPWHVLRNRVGNTSPGTCTVCAMRTPTSVLAARRHGQQERKALALLTTNVVVLGPQLAQKLVRQKSVMETTGPACGARCRAHRVKCVCATGAGCRQESMQPLALHTRGGRGSTCGRPRALPSTWAPSRLPTAQELTLANAMSSMSSVMAARPPTCSGLRPTTSISATASQQPAQGEGVARAARTHAATHTELIGRRMAGGGSLRRAAGRPNRSEDQAAEGAQDISGQGSGPGHRQTLE